LDEVPHPPANEFMPYFKYTDELQNIKMNTHSFEKEYDIDIRNNGECIFAPPTIYYDNNN